MSRTSTWSSSSNKKKRKTWLMKKKAHGFFVIVYLLAPRKRFELNIATNLKTLLQKRFDDAINSRNH